jgi:hypothetical protein
MPTAVRAVALAPFLLPAFVRLPPPAMLLAGDAVVRGFVARGMCLCVCVCVVYPWASTPVGPVSPAARFGAPANVCCDISQRRGLGTQSTRTDMQPPRAPAKAKAKAAQTPDKDPVDIEEVTPGCADLQPSTNQASDQVNPYPAVTPDNDDSTALQQPPQELPSPADQAQQEIKRLEAEVKMLSEANDSLEAKLAAFQEFQAEREHTHTALVAQHQQLMRLIPAAESTFYDIQCYDICAPASETIDWPRCFGKLLAALRATFMYHDC